MTTTDTRREPRTIPPVSLHDSSSGRWLRNWSNDLDLFVTDDNGNMVRDSRDKLAYNPRYLAANIFRDRADSKRRWTINFFLAGERAVAHMQDDVWSLRMVRQLLAYLATDWNPTGTGEDTWHLTLQLRDAVHQAWLEAADAQILRIEK